MSSRTTRSIGARCYALLLYLYPPSFRREYSESMLQLFNDQCRAVNGAGGHAMLWLKTLRDLLLSVPAAHSSQPRRTSTGARFVWTLLVILGLAFLLNAMVLPAMIARVPSDGVAAVVETPGVAPTGEYRAVAQVVVAVVSTLLVIGAFLFAVRQRSMATGAAAFVAGAALTFVALAMNPWLWLPRDQYPVAIAWALGIWPLAAVAWAVSRGIGGRRKHELGGV
jgi:hypothetical protein